MARITAGVGCSHVPAIGVAMDTGITDQPGTVDFRRFRPTRRAVGGHQPRLPRPPDRHTDSNHHRRQATGPGDGTAGDKHAGRIGVEEEPPVEQAPWVVNRFIE